MQQPSLFERVVVPVASEADARATASAVVPYLRESGGHATVVHVIEKAGGAPDKASVEQREDRAEDVFAVVSEALSAAALPHETRLLYGTDVAGAIAEAADEEGASAIVFTPRGGNLLVRFVTGDVGRSSTTEADRPVVVLPGGTDD